VTRLAVLLRGINVGRHKRIKMADLRALLEAAGYRDVRTLLQSGNVVLETDSEPEAAARDIERAIAERTGFDVDVVIRTPEELAEVVRADPLGDVRTDGARHFVVFCSTPPAPEVVQRLEAQDFGSERWTLLGRDLHLWCPDGVQDSPLMKAATDARAVHTATARNWNTVEKLLALAQAPG
jgi:uncharacterized protein (DUF1697 family)